MWSSGTRNSPASIHPAATASLSSWLGSTPGVASLRSASARFSTTQAMMPSVWRRAVPAALVPWLWFVVRDTSVVFELVAVLLPLLVVVTFAVLVGLAVHWRWVAVPAASVALMGFVAVVLPWIPIDTGTPAQGVTISVSNVLNDNPSPAGVAEDI